MKALYVVRHGIAEERSEDGEDAARELTGKGKDRMKQVAKSLAAEGVKFDVILSSPLVRAVQTARILEKHCTDGGPAVVTELLRGDASFDDLIGDLNGLEGAGSVAIVGHEPFLSGFVSYCLSGQPASFVRMKKGSVAALEVAGAVQPGHCILAWLLEPGQLARL